MTSRALRRGSRSSPPRRRPLPLPHRRPEQVGRRRELARLGGVERSIRLKLGDSAIAARPIADGVERTSDAGKTSAVHFLSFDFNAGEIKKFRDAALRAVISISHSNYGHMAVIPEDTRRALGGDFA